jgi:hypothetical protein
VSLYEVFTGGKLLKSSLVVYDLLILKHSLYSYIPKDFGLTSLNRRFRSLGINQYELTMGEELLWGVKNGDLDKVRELVEKKVSTLFCSRKQMAAFLYTA